MVLCLCVHTVEAPSAKVPLSMIILNDLIKRNSIPAHLRCRFVLPTSGQQSVTVWDAPDMGSLQQWIDENLNQDGFAHVQEVQEDFSYGIVVPLASVRAKDKVAAGSKTMADKISVAASRAVDSAHLQLEALDQRTNIVTATKETTNAAYTRVKSVTEQALKNETVSASLSKASAAFSWMGSKVRESLNMPPPSTNPNAGAPPYTVAGSYDPYLVDSEPLHMPVSTGPRAGGPDASPMAAAAATHHDTWGSANTTGAGQQAFTLHDDAHEELGGSKPPPPLDNLSIHDR